MVVEAEEDPPPPAQHQQPQQQNQQRQHVLASYSGRVASRSRLHNFSFPSVSWGSQRLLRCAKVEPRADLPGSARGGVPLPAPSGDRGSVADERSRRPVGASVSPEAGSRVRDERAEGEGDVEEHRDEDERLNKFSDVMMAEFRKACDRIPLPPTPPRPSGPPPGEQKEEMEKSPAAASTAEVARPWNLRLRRAACNAPASTMENVKARPSPSAPEKNSGVPAKYLLRSDVGLLKEERRPKFSPVLSREDIVEDFFAMTGSKPPRRPKKRPRNVQKQLENLYPGLYLAEVTPDLYKITEDM